MDSSERSDSSRRDGKPNGKTGEGSSSALKELVKRAALQPEPPAPPAAGTGKPHDGGNGRAEAPKWRRAP